MLTEDRQVLIELAKQELARRDFWAFCLYMDEEFFYEREEVLQEIAFSMQNLVFPEFPDDELDILNVSLPPRTGKSYLCSLFVAWVLGKDPTQSIMRNTVTATLYNKFSRDIKTIMQGESHRGRYLDVFPDIQFATTTIEGWKLTASEQGVTYFGAGFEGSIIGFGATKLSIVDDSVGSEFEALNEYALDKKWGWYGSAMDSREEKGCKKLFIGTRWSKRDIVGRLVDLGFFRGDRAKQIVVPAINAEGVSFCEAIHTTESLMNKKLLTSDIIWEAEWQQNPVEAKGLVFPMGRLNRFKRSDLFTTEGKIKRKPDAILATIDTADEGTDSLGAIVALVYGEKVYIVDMVFNTEPIEVTQPLVSSLLDRMNVQKAIFESNNGGKGFAMKVKELIRGKTVIKWRPSSSNKHTRILVSSAHILENFYFLEEGKDGYALGSEYYNYMVELTAYNITGKVLHDDAPDVTTMMSNLITDKNKLTFLR